MVKVDCVFPGPTVSLEGLLVVIGLGVVLGAGALLGGALLERIRRGMK